MDEVEQLLTKCQSIIQQQLFLQNNSTLIHIQKQCDSLFSLVQQFNKDSNKDGGASRTTTSLDGSNRRDLEAEEEQQQKLVAKMTSDDDTLVQHYGDFDEVFRLPEIVFHIMAFLPYIDRNRLNCVNKVFMELIRGVLTPITHLDLNANPMSRNFLRDAYSFEHVKQMNGSLNEDSLLSFHEWISYHESELISDPDNCILSGFNMDLTTHNFDTLFIECIKRKNIQLHADQRQTEKQNPQQQQQMQTIVQNPNIVSLNALLPPGLERLTALSCPNLTHVMLVNHKHLSEFTKLTSVCIIDPDDSYEFPYMANLTKLTLIHNDSLNFPLVKTALMNCPNLTELNLAEKDLDSIVDDEYVFDPTHYPNNIQKLTTSHVYTVFPVIMHNLTELRISRPYSSLDSEAIRGLINMNRHSLTRLNINAEDLSELSGVELPSTLTWLDINAENGSFHHLKKLAPCKQLKHLHLIIEGRDEYEFNRPYSWKLPVFEHLESLSMFTVDIDFKAMKKLKSVKLYGPKAICIFESESLEYIDVSRSKIYNITVNCPKLRVFKPPRSLLALQWKRSGSVDLDLKDASQFYSLMVSDSDCRLNSLQLGLTNPSIPLQSLYHLQELRAAYHILLPEKENLKHFHRLTNLTLVYDRAVSPNNNLSLHELHDLVSRLPSIEALSLWGMNIEEKDDDELSKNVIFTKNLKTLSLRRTTIGNLTTHFPGVIALDIDNKSIIHGEYERNIVKLEFNSFGDSLVSQQFNSCHTFENFINLEYLELDVLYEDIWDSDLDTTSESSDSSNAENCSNLKLSNASLKHLTIGEMTDPEYIKYAPNLISITVTNGFEDRITMKNMAKQLENACTKLQYIDIGTNDVAIIRNARGSFYNMNDDDDDEDDSDFSDSSSSSDSSHDDENEDYYLDNDDEDVSQSEDDDDGNGDDDDLFPRRPRRYLSNRRRRRNGNQSPAKKKPDQPRDSLLEQFVHRVASTNPDLKVVKGRLHMANKSRALVMQMLSIYETLSRSYPNTLFAFELEGDHFDDN